MDFILLNLYGVSTATWNCLFSETGETEYTRVETKETHSSVMDWTSGSMALRKWATARTYHTMKALKLKYICMQAYNDNSETKTCFLKIKLTNKKDFNF